VVGLFLTKPEQVRGTDAARGILLRSEELLDDALQEVRARA
jgi:hypothetical protein